MKRAREDDVDDERRSKSDDSPLATLDTLLEDNRLEIRRHLSRMSRIDLSRVCRLFHREDGAAACVSPPDGFRDYWQCPGDGTLVAMSRYFLRALVDTDLVNWPEFAEFLLISATPRYDLACVDWKAYNPRLITISWRGGRLYHMVYVYAPGDWMGTEVDEELTPTVLARIRAKLDAPPPPSSDDDDDDDHSVIPPST